VREREREKERDKQTESTFIVWILPHS